MKFIDLTLRIEERRADGYTVTAESGLGHHGRGLCKLDPASQEIQDTLAAIADSDSPLEGEALAAFGQRLGAELLNGEAKEVFDKTVGAAQAQTKAGTKTGVRVQLRIAPDELNIIPWELARVDEEPLSVSSQNAITRYLEVNVPKRDLTVDKPLRMLGIIPQGSGLDVEKEKEAINKAVERLGDVLQLTWLDGTVTTENIRDALGEADYHLIHFIGHGNFKNGLATLQMNDDYGDSTAVRAETVAGFFRNRESVRLVVLNACRGATRDSGNAMVGVAPQIVLKGVPAVAAMQWDFNDRMAQLFAKSFYRSLCVGPEAGEVDTALARGRGALYDEYPDSRGFATPVLFFRADGEDGQLWESEEKKAAKAEAEKGGAAAQVTNITNTSNVTNIQQGGIQVGEGASISIGSGDFVGGNKTTAGGNIVNAGAGANVNLGGNQFVGSPGASANDPLALANALTEITKWETQMRLKLNTLADLSPDDRKEVAQKISQVKAEAVKGAQADPARLEKLINTIGAMAPDIFEVTVAMLANPLAGIGLVMKKIGDKARVERGA